MSGYGFLQYITQTGLGTDWTNVAYEIEDNGILFDEDSKEITVTSDVVHAGKDVLQLNPYQLANLGRYDYTIQFENFECGYTISELQSNLDDRMVQITGRVDHVTDTDAVVAETVHECQECGERTTKTQNILQAGLEEPTTCATCEKSRFSELEDQRERVDRKTAVVSELVDDATEDSESIVLRLFRDEDREAIRAGERVEITGILKHIDNNKTGESHKEIVVLNVETDDSDSVDVPEEKEQELVEFTQSDDYEQKLIDSFAPHVVCRDKEKRGLLYSAVSGSGGVPEHLRDTSHALMIGDPSTGKSELMKYLQEVLPNSVMATGSSSTGVGLTATVEKNEETGETIASAGALAHAHNGVAFVDELDEFSEDSLGKLLSTLSDSQIKLNKYNINTTLPANTVFIGSANPQYGEFSGHMNIKDEFDFPPELLARMDQIFVVEKDPSNAVEKAKAQAGIGGAQDPPLSKDDLKMLIYLARQKKVHYGQDMLEYASEMVGQLIQNSDAGDMRSGGAVHRLAVSSAKLHLRDEVTKEDVDKAIELVAESLERIGEGSVQYTGLTEDRVDAEQAVEEVLEVIYEDIDEAPTRQNITERLVESKDMDKDTVQSAIEAKLEQPEFFEVDGKIQVQASD